MIYKASLLMLITAIVAGTGKVTKIEPQYPFEDIRLNSLGEVYIKAEKGVDIRGLFNLMAFEEVGLTPGADLESTVALIGEPSEIFSEHSGRDQVYQFDTRHGKIQLASQFVSSEGAEVERWFLRLRVESNRDVLSDPSTFHYILSAMEGSADIQVGIVLPQAETVKIEVIDNSVKYLWWLS